MNNDDKLSNSLNIDMCIEQMKSKMSDDIIMQQIYVSLCVYKIETEKLQEENERLRTVLNGSEEKRKKAIEWVKKHIETYQKNEIVILDWDNFSDPRNLLKILVDGDDNG